MKNTLRCHLKACFGYLFPLLLVLAFPLVSSAALQKSIVFSYKDWDLICDNTLTCQAAGYSRDNGEPASSVLISRKAGIATPINNQVALAVEDDDTLASQAGQPSLWIAEKSLGNLLPVDDNIWQMTHQQFALFLQALKQNQAISFKNKLHRYRFSGDGSNAVLLKMDDVQGRVGTPSALFKKGNRSDTRVKQPIPAPIIKQVTTLDQTSRAMTAQEKTALKPILLKFFKQHDNQCDDEQLAGDWQISRLNQKQSLVIVPCWMAAYNFGNAYLVISNDHSTAPVMATDRGTDYDGGVIMSQMKGRGIGDCWAFENWTWDGKRFVHSGVSDTGRCTMIEAGGPWNISTFTTQILLPTARK